ncbi:piezo non-specific cation channel, r-Ras-binding domain-containing protein [Phthorimaea operculella]|nr:piezo non-specific cation channel, r-Ras-binding domain-containing protein [Phthorimaea operculella]
MVYGVGSPRNPPTIEDSREVELPAHDEKVQRTQERIMLSKMLTNDTTPDDCNNPQNPPTIEDSREVELPAHDEKGQRTQERIMLSKMLTNDTTPDDCLRNPPTIEDSREVELPAHDEKGQRTQERIMLSKMLTNDTNPNDCREVELPAHDEKGQRTQERIMLSKMLTNDTTPDDWLKIGLMFPKFLKVFNKGTAKPAYQLMLPPSSVDPSTTIPDDRLYRDVLMRLERDRGAMYWRVRENCTKEYKMQSYPRDNCDMLVMFTFNDKLFPETLNFISGGGIIGLYTTFVFLASRVIRGFFSGIYTKIMFDDLPNVDRVLQLCLDIYLVREALELALEEDLFAKLVFLYRSPETMIKLIKHFH